MDCRKAIAAVAVLFAVFTAGNVLADQVSSPYYTIYSGAFETCSSHTNSSLYDTFFILQSMPDMQLTSSDFTLTSGFVKLMGWESALSPIISSIAPASGYNIAPVHIDKIEGINFSDAIVVKLVATGESDIVAKNISIVSANELNCDLDITGAKAGYWDVVVSREGNAASSLHNGFEVKRYSYAANIAVNSPNPFDNTRENTTIAYRLERNTDVNIYIFSVTGDLIWKDTFASGINGAREGDNSVSWNGVSNFSEVLSNGVYLLHVVEKQTGKTLAKGKIMIIRR